MATGIIDLQSRLQIKPQDKMGRRTMKDHRTPHGNEMTTGLSGRPKTNQPPSGKSEKKCFYSNPFHFFFSKLKNEENKYVH